MKKIFLFMVCYTAVFAQTTKVVKILDANLFELKDGRIVKLAGIDAPGISHPSKFYRDAANEAMAYSTTNLLGRTVSIELISNVPGKDYELVFIYKEYILERLNLSTRFLLYGYAKCYNNIDSIYNEEFQNCQQTAIEKQRGIWQNKNLTSTDTLDLDFVHDRTQINSDIDSLWEYNAVLPKPVYYAVPLQILAGSGITFLSCIGSSFLAATVAGHNLGALGFAILGTAAGYVLGFPLGVYLVEKSSNPDLSYWATLGFSTGLTAVTTYFSFTFFQNDHNHFTRYIALASPIIGSLIYANIIAPKPSQIAKDLQQQITRNNFTFKDYYNSTLLLNIDLFRVNFNGSFMR